jgi:hypothetical protein
MSWHLLDALPKDGTRVLFFIPAHELEFARFVTL